MDEIRDFHWTSKGASHLARAKNCEDASLSISQKDFVIACAADGHGANYCFRSHTGSQYAVETAWQALQLFMQEARTEDARQQLKDPARRRHMFSLLAQHIVGHWKKRVQDDLDDNPVTFLELAQNHLYSMDDLPLNDQTLIYGSTVLFAAMNKSICLLGQQGDGRICVLYGDGTMNMPVPWDKRCYSNVTTSLCDSDASASMRFTWIDLEAKPVAAVFLLSDGIEDSFEDFEGMYDFLLEVVSGYYHNRNNFESYLAEQLSQLSSSGSRDDISLAGFFVLPVLSQIMQPIDLKVTYHTLSHQLQQLSDELYRMLERRRKVKDPKEVDLINFFYKEGKDEYAQMRTRIQGIYDQMMEGKPKQS